MLIENNAFYDALESSLRAFYHDCKYVFVHAIYEPDDDGGPHEGMYHAAVDLFEEGQTYHVWFTLSLDDVIDIDCIERWLMG